MRSQMSTEVNREIELEIAYVLFIDIVGYSKLVTSEQRRLIELLNRIVCESEHFCAAEAKGRLISVPTGDGMVLVFYNTPEAPVECALEVSSAASQHPDLKLRMGVHSGPVSGVVDVSGRSNIAGAGINIAQRVMDCGDAGHVLVSKHMAEDLEQYGHWKRHLHDLGECEVKHGVRVSVANLYTEDHGNPEVPQKFRQARKAAVPIVREKKGRGWTIAVAAVLVAALIIAGVFYSRRSAPVALGSGAPPAPPATPMPTAAATPNQKSIAVLPFVDLSQAHDQEYFCDGISEEILDALAKVEDLRVVARTSSFSFKGKNADVNEIAQKLNVQNVLEGSLRREGNRIRVTAQLINARDGFHIWSDTFERDLQGVFAVQDEITRAIVDALKVKLAVAPSEHAPQNTEAYDLYLQGLYFSNKGTEEALRNALGLFHRALDKDPTFGRAWTGIANVWNWLADAYVKPLEAYPAERFAALKAISLNERDAEAHCYLGDTKRVLDWDFAGDEAELNRALQLDPNSAFAHFILALLRFAQCDLDEGFAQIREAEKLDPLSPGISDFAAFFYVQNGRLDDAIREGQRTLELDPNYVYPALDSNLATAYREKGEYAEAITLYLKAQEAMRLPSSGLAITYARTGRQREARRILNELVEKARVQYVAADRIAAVYVALGQNDDAFRWLERAAADRNANLHAIGFERDFLPLRGDPRFADLLRRIGVDPVKALARQKNP
jgi:TolB-like protein/class 3 adenylate cyclase/Tfp pilus assembly protein PilF